MDGILIVKKEKGYTSHDVVAKVKKITKTKVGHTGTLDPMATGVLPLLLGEGTKLSKYLIEHDKVYEATIQLGEKTDTADSEGQVIEEKEVNINLFNNENIEKVFESLKGKQIQTPPIYSAIKVKGKKLYEYARNNETVKIPNREIEIYEMQLIKCDLEERTIDFKVHCSKGTYIRSLCETIAEKLDTVGYMKELNRTKVGKFDIEQAVTIEEIEKSILDEILQKDCETEINKKGIKIDFWKKHLITIEEIFQTNPSITLSEQKLVLLLNGVQLTRKEENGVYRVYEENGRFIGIGIIENHLLKRDIIITRPN